MKLVTSVTYTYKVNGFASAKLVPQRGLRQGDPLSPYILILAVDVLSHMLNKAVEEDRIQGIQLVEGGPKLTHLFFVDDALLFGQASMENMYQFVDILNTYSKASGQRINLAKSGIICGKFMEHRAKVQMTATLHMQLWDNPGKYLGLPAEWGRSKVSALSWIRERIEMKIEGWKECLLNQAGKETLIKAVLQAIPTFAMSMVRFPKNFCAQICSSIARFWWRAGGKERGIHWKSWNFLTSNKSEGGLGFKDFTHMNSALLAKQAWRVIHCLNALWVRVLKTLYFPNADFVRARRKRNDSWVWASIIHGKEMLLQNARWVVGSGENIDIYTDRWLASGELISLNANPNLSKVKDIIDPINKCWNIRLIRENFQPAQAIQILQTPIAWNCGQDSIWWPKSKSRDFTVKSGYYQMKKAGQSYNTTPSSSSIIAESIWKEIWGLPIPQKIKFFLWKCCHNVLPVKENLRKKRLTASAVCPLCEMEDESVEHALLFCDWTRAVWFGLQIQCVPSRNSISSFHEWFGQRLKEVGQQKEFRVFSAIVVSCTLWAIWKGRNQMIFNYKKPVPLVVLTKANLLQRDYFSHWQNQTRSVRPPSHSPDPIRT